MNTNTIALIVIIAALVLLLSGTFSFPRLPGDLRIRRENFELLLPLGTCLLVSIVISICLAVFGRK